MAFYLSPGVKFKETDLTPSIPAIATSIAALVVRQPFKGEEYEQHYITNEDQLIDTTGKPISTSYKDVLSGLGFLKYGNSLYVSIARPADATFAGTKILSGYQDEGEALDKLFSYTTESVGIGDYDCYALGTTDLTQYPDFASTIASDEMFHIIANYRGNGGNSTRVLILDQDLYNSIRYSEIASEELIIDLPSGITVSSLASASAVNMYEAYRDNPDFGEVGYEDTLGWTEAVDLATPVTDDKHFIILVQAQNQGSTTWELKEQWLVSAKESDIDDSGDTMFVESVINNQSNYIRIAINTNHKSTMESDKGKISIGTEKFVQLEDGEEGVFGRADSSTAAEGEDAAVIEAYRLYANADEIDINLFIDSDKNEAVKTDLIEICEVTRKDCMAILDPPSLLVQNNKGSEASDLVEWRQGQGTSTFNPNTSYAALYGNWLEVFDRYNKTYKWIPSSGYVAGLYAHTDDVTDPWMAPAGLNRAILKGVRRLAFNPTTGEMKLLCKSGINPIVSFTGQGKVVWDQLTLLDKSSAFRSVNVRRLFLVLEKAISKSAKYFIHEQNDQVTWTLLKNMINPFLRDVKGRRGIIDFLVQIDNIVNTPERMDREELWGNIWIKPVRSTKFLVLNFIATKSGASFDELIASGVA